MTFDRSRLRARWYREGWYSDRTCLDPFAAAAVEHAGVSVIFLLGDSVSRPTVGDLHELATYRMESEASDWAWFAFLLGWIYRAIEMFSTAVVELMDDRPEPMVPPWLSWQTIAGVLTVFMAAGPAFFKSGPFAYQGCWPSTYRSSCGACT